MNPARQRQPQKGSLELIEEAIHLLRAAPMSAWADYYLGSLPFVLGLLYFWADMSRSPFADQHLAGATLGLASLYLWMKFWQTLAVRRLRAALAGSPAPPVTVKLCGEIFIAQAALQPTGLFLVPLALAATLPFAWVYAFYQNVTVLAEGQAGELRLLIKKSMRQAALWPKQSHFLLSIVFLFGLFVFLNWATFCLLLPQVAKLLFGVESVFTRGGLSMVNSTFFAAVFGLTYLCVDPIVKAIYTLRCFYGESVQSGEDLKAELRGFATAARRAMSCLMIFGALLGPRLETAEAVELPEGQAATPPTGRVNDIRAYAGPTEARGAKRPRAADLQPSAGSGANSQPNAVSISAPELDRAIQDVMQQRKYAWRMPREKIIEPKDARDGIINRFLKRVANLLSEWLKAAGSWLDAWLRRLFFRNRQVQPGGSGYGWILAQELLLGVLVLAVLAGLGFLFYRVWRDRRPGAAAVASEPIQPAPDLADETVGADQLPEDGWTRLARELLARGELRLALRAFYLASLAHLAGQNLIRLAKFKSNHDYERELGRRAHAFPDLLTVFGENVSVFDRTWYGRHEVSRDTITRFAANVERIKGTT
jgi:hypothetical protein